MQQRPTMRQHMMLSLLGLVLASICIACAPKLVGPTTPSGYFYALETSDRTIWLGYNLYMARGYYPTEADIAVHVQDGQGQPVDGVPVLFEVEPIWAQKIVLSPLQTVTRAGVARAILSQPQTTGMVSITARVDNTTARTSIEVRTYKERSVVD